jgi:hypothetical protein
MGGEGLHVWVEGMVGIPMYEPNGQGIASRVVDAPL